MENFLFTVNIVAPVFLMVALGYFLKVINLINDQFVDVTSKFVFNVSLPALVFIKISAVRLQQVLQIRDVVFIYACIITIFIISGIVAYIFTKSGEDRGAIIQGGYRSNFAIVGLAILGNMYGSEVVGYASLLLMFIMPLFNVLAVIALTVPMKKAKSLDLKGTLLEILKNPLILAIIFSIPFSYYQIEIYDPLNISANYLAALALPLALVGIGANLNIRNLFTASAKAYLSSSLKIVFSPILAVSTALLMGYRGETLGIIFILFAAPSAIVSFIMAKAMGSNETLAGNIVVITTLGSIITISIGTYILKSLGMI